MLIAISKADLFFSFSIHVNWIELNLSSKQAAMLFLLGKTRNNISISMFVLAFLFSIIHWKYVWCWFNYSEFLFVYTAVNIEWIHFNYPNVNGMCWIWSKLFVFNIIRKLLFESIIQIEYYNVYNFVNTNFVSFNWIDGFLCMQQPF